MEPLLRAAEPADVPKIMHCYLDSWRAAYKDDFPDALLNREADKRRSFDWLQGIGSEQSVVIIAIQGETVLGVVQSDLALPPPRNLPEVTMLYVDPRYWGTSVAAKLLGAGLDWIAQQGLSAARIRVVESHGRARLLVGLADHATRRRREAR